MTQRTFRRHELKYRLDPARLAALRPLLAAHMDPDGHGRDGMYMIYSIYFDTGQDDIIRRSIAGTAYREKLRLRCYQLPRGDGDPVYLELKRKIGGVVSKRRATLAYGQAKGFLETGEIPVPLAFIDRQVLNEIAAFLERFPARPKVFISYERLALHGCDDPEFRITVDRGILTRRTEPTFEAGDHGIELLDSDDSLMEVKVNGAMPLWLAQGLSQLGIFSSGFSKYGEEYKAYAQARFGPTAGRGRAQSTPAGIARQSTGMSRQPAGIARQSTGIQLSPREVNSHA